MKLFVIRLDEFSKMPDRKNATDAGLDLYALHSYTIKPHAMQIVRTGVSIEIPENYMGLIKPKSKTNFAIGAGVVDHGYAPGEILVKVLNTSNDELKISRHEGVAQMILVPVLIPEFKEVSLEGYAPAVTARSNSGGVLDQLNKATPMDDDFYNKLLDSLE